MGFFVGGGIVAADEQDAHFVIVYLAELVEVKAGNDARPFADVAFGVQIGAVAGTNVIKSFNQLASAGCNSLLPYTIRMSIFIRFLSSSSSLMRSLNLR